MVQRDSSKKRTRTVFFFLIAVAAIVGVAFCRKPSVSSLSPIPEDPKSGIFDFLIIKKQKNPEELKKKITGMVGNSWSNYAVLVVQLDGNFRMGINEDGIFTAASINKIPILASTYFLIQKGDVDPDRIITLQSDEIQAYGTGSIQYDEPGTTYSIKTLLSLMMKKSDNTAAYILANEIDGMDKVQALIDSWGLSQTDMVNNKTSLSDMAILMKKMTGEKIANHALTLDMLSTMKDSDFEDRIPALLPKEGVSVYHKIGNGAGFLHDVGIVTTPTTQYFIGVMTSDVRDEAATTKLIAQISRTVYDFMQ